MHIIKYLLLFAFVFLIFKAFFLDDYLAKRDAENNETTAVVEENISTPPPPPVQEEPKTHPTAKKNEGMPIDQLGDKIADKFGDKL
jgi:hypothetical protein